MSDKSPKISLSKSLQIDKNVFQKMVFITNALNDGWTVRKNDNSYIFTKKHENRREIFQESYLETFVGNCMEIKM